MKIAQSYFKASQNKTFLQEGERSRCPTAAENSDLWHGSKPLCAQGSRTSSTNRLCLHRESGSSAFKPHVLCLPSQEELKDDGVPFSWPFTHQVCSCLSFSGVMAPLAWLEDSGEGSSPKGSDARRCLSRSTFCPEHSAATLCHTSWLIRFL